MSNRSKINKKSSRAKSKGSSLKLVANKTILKVLQLIKKYWVMVILSLVFAALSVAMTLYIPILIGKAVDLIVAKGFVDFKGVLNILMKIGILVVLTSLCQWIMNLLNNKITFSIVKDIRSKAFDKLSILPLKYIDRHQHGDIISRMVADVDHFSEGLLMGFTQFCTGVLTILGTLLFMLSVNIKITLVVVFITPVSLFVASYIAKHTHQMFKEQSERKGDMTSLINEMIGNQKIVQAFHYEDEIQKQFDEINEKLQYSSLRAIFFSSITNPATRFVNGLVYSGVGLFGALGVLSGGITIGQLTSFLSYANQYTKPFNEISGVITELQNAITCAARVFELIEEEPQIPDRNDSYVLVDADGKVELEHVNFSYNPNIKLIEDFNLEVKPGQRIAIVGPTGCGKTTIINLLMRFYDVDSGSIRVSGFDVRDITRKSLRSNYGMVLQDTWIKSDTILENIRYGKPEATKEEVIAAAKAAYAHSFIRRLPKGYDTFVTDEGGDLSQGQKQLICIARVMLTLPPMLILDEATSSIDTRTEIRIQKAFARMMKGRTSFIVAHRLSTIREADVILVMKDGNIIEKGTHEELLDKKGFYQELYLSQFKGTDVNIA